MVLRDPRLFAALALSGLVACVPGAPSPDLDGNGRVGPEDVEIILACSGLAPGTAGCARADTDGDGVIDANDLFSLAEDYGRLVCNGSAKLCERRYDQVVHPTSHNAFSSWARFSLYFNQWDEIPAQLEHGIRGLMLDAWPFDGNGNATIDPGESYLCHADCGWARRPLDEGLAELRGFLEARPGEVLTIIFESYLPPSEIAAAFERSGLSPYALEHAPGTQWPTLGEMIGSGRRLVVLSDSAGAGSPAWYVPVWSVASETPFTAATRDDLGCAPLRGDPANELFVLNHFLTRNTSVPAEAALTNETSFLVDRARRCWRERNRLPNFPTVDFATTGGAVEASRVLNDDFARYGGAPPPP